MLVNVIFEEIDEKLSADFFEDERELDTDFGEVHVISDEGEAYDGEYAITPMTKKQVMPTKGKIMADDVVVNPIPQEYGLITYDHNRTITVS